MKKQSDGFLWTNSLPNPLAALEELTLDWTSAWINRGAAAPDEIRGDIAFKSTLKQRFVSYRHDER